MDWKIVGEYSEDNRKMYRVECSVCGYQKGVRRNMIGLSTRCKRCFTIDRNRKSYGKHHGVGGLMKSFYTYFKVTAGRRGIEFSVSIEYLWNLFEKQGKRCALSGVPLEMPRYSGFGGGGATGPNTPSLDRIDSDRGYVEGNVQWLHKLVNLAKNDITQEGFIALCHAVASQHANPQPSVLTGAVSRRWSGGRKALRDVSEVRAKVQRLTDDGSSQISLTRVPDPSTEGDEIVRHSGEIRRAQDKEPA